MNLNPYAVQQPLWMRYPAASLYRSIYKETGQSIKKQVNIK